MIEILLEHLAIWIISFIVSLGLCDSIKSAAICTVGFMLALYGWLGISYIIIVNGGHIPI